MAKTGKKYYCKTCGKTMGEDEFYTSTRLDRFPLDGKLPECKKCLTRHVNNWEPDTFLPILEALNLPWIPDEWDTLLTRYGKDPLKITGTTILGRYAAKMKLNQWRKYGWDDSEQLQAEAEAQKRQLMEDQGMGEEEIEEQLKTVFHIEKPDIIRSADDSTDFGTDVIDAFAPDNDFADQLTDDDKTYLTIKWGKMYKPYEWVQLEQYYNDMCESFDIQTPAHIDYLKLICKTSLKSHQLLDLGDVDGFQKMAKVYDQLMKSAKFQPAQNKTEGGEYVNSISEFITLCEREGFIPKYYVVAPQDKVDETLMDNRSYVDKLIRDELNLGNLIENALAAMKQQEQEDAEESSNDEDIDEYNEISEFVDSERAMDEALLDGEDFEDP